MIIQPGTIVNVRLFDFLKNEYYNESSIECVVLAEIPRDRNFTVAPTENNPVTVSRLPFTIWEYEIIDSYDKLGENL